MRWIFAGERAASPVRGEPIRRSGLLVRGLRNPADCVTRVIARGEAPRQSRVTDAPLDRRAACRASRDGSGSNPLNAQGAPLKARDKENIYEEKRARSELAGELEQIGPAIEPLTVGVIPSRSNSARDMIGCGGAALKAASAFFSRGGVRLVGNSGLSSVGRKRR